MQKEKALQPQTDTPITVEELALSNNVRKRKSKRTKIEITKTNIGALPVIEEE